MVLDPSNSPVTQSGGDVIYTLMDGEKRVRVRISLEALEDIDGSANHKSPVNQYARYRERFDAMASFKYELGQLEDDGHILIKTEDLGRGPRSHHAKRADR